MKRAVAIIFVWGAALLAAGCGGGQASVNDWKQHVERYIAERGQGDPNVLRDALWHADHRAFVVHGGKNPARSTDRVGLLMGHAPVAGRPALIFLVAQVSRNEVDDIRIAALSGAGPKLQWRLGGPNPQALEVYRRSRSADREHPPWPARGDAFEMTASTSAITVTERRSGANWTLPLAAPQQAAGSLSVNR